jgi:hypothetical protein
MRQVQGKFRRVGRQSLRLHCRGGGAPPTGESPNAQPRAKGPLAARKPDATGAAQAVNEIYFRATAKV